MNTSAIDEVRKLKVYTLSDYWKTHDEIKARNGQYQAGVFDFISVHNHGDGTFRLVSPLCLVIPSGSRPAFEQEVIKTHQGAIMRAAWLAMYHGTDEQPLNVVDCTALIEQAS